MSMNVLISDNCIYVTVRVSLRKDYYTIAIKAQSIVK